MKNNSIWLEDLNYKPNKSLSKNIEVDVLIIGGGITGMSTAYHLKDSNLKVCLVEKNSIGHGVTSRTTAKLTYLQELIYTKLKKYHSTKISKLYLESQIEAIKLVKDIIKENNIDCNYNKVTSYVFTNQEKEFKKIDKEKELLESFNVKVNSSNKLPNNLKFEKGIYVENSSIFHPLKYLISLKEKIKDTIDIYENTKINSIKNEEDFYICKTNKYKIKAKKIVLGIHYPYFIVPYLFPLKCYLEKSYVCACKVEKNLKFSAITSSKPTLSIRYHEDSNNTYEINLNGSHNLCVKNDEADNFKDLLKGLDKEPDFIWSNKDIMTSDYLPYIGEIKDNLLIGTGYNTWGMTNGSIAGKILSDIIQNKKNKYIELFNPKRDINLAKIINYPVNIASNMKSFIGSKIVKDKSWYKNNVQFKKIDGKNVAIYIDENNVEHIVYNTCPHLKCGLIFNEVEKTWDCPCHGSRFDIDGKCIEGPSNYDIVYKD